MPNHSDTTVAQNALERDAYYSEVIQKLTELKDQNKNFYGWSASIYRNRSDQRLMNATEDNRLEASTVRDNINETSVSVTLITKNQKNNTMGSFSLVLDPFAELKEQLIQAYGNAQLSHNPPWSLIEPPAEPYDELMMIDPQLLENPSEQTELLCEEASEACRGLDGIKVNYAELFVNQSSSFTQTSTGVKMPMQRSSLYFELALERLPLPNRQEVHNKVKAIDREGLALKEFIGECAEECVALGEVQLPQTQAKATILIHARSAHLIFKALLSRLSADAEHKKRPHCLAGEKIYEGELSSDASPLNLTLDPTIPLMAGSTPYFDAGYKSRAAKVIENGVVLEQIVSQRMADYLDKEVNPICGNLVIDCGSESKKALLSKEDTVIEIIAFSSLLVNPNLLTWSSEIKMAKEINNTTGEVKLLKGGVISGNIAQNISSMILSRETKKISDGYVGPEVVLFRDGVSIAGVN